jgi:hypothetical protein
LGWLRIRHMHIIAFLLKGSDRTRRPNCLDADSYNHGLVVEVSWEGVGGRVSLSGSIQ